MVSLVRLTAKLGILRLTQRLTFTIPLVYLPQHPLLFRRCGFQNLLNLGCNTLSPSFHMEM